MPAARIEQDELLERLTGVFRLYGYEGASLSRISRATGLQRASLYHRFPAGKDEMALAVLRRADEWLSKHVMTPLRGPGEPAGRVREMAARLKEFYGNGSKSCLLDSLSLGDPDDAVHRHARRSLEVWRDALAKLSREAGLPPAEARRRAVQALVEIQGALVLARALGDRKPFSRVLENLPGLLTRI